MGRRLKPTPAGQRRRRAAAAPAPSPLPDLNEGVQDDGPRESYELPAAPREAVDEQGLAPGPAVPDSVSDAAIERELDAEAAEPDGSGLPPHLRED